jgi:hypothetical protein
MVRRELGALVAMIITVPRVMLLCAVIVVAAVVLGWLQ